MPTLHWIGKEKTINHHFDVPYRVLDHQYGYTEKGKQEQQTNSGNKIIHGDNLEALKSLLPEYEGKINCIYIDPPYNTGNEGWVYNDNVNHPKITQWLGKVVGKGSEDLTRHDKWLCMMYPRLQLLHRLLASDGTIFISIDDNELSSLNLVLQEVFGVDNYITQFIWEKKNVVQNDSKFVSTNHEYIICYRKTSKLESFNLLPRTKEANARYSNPDNDPKGSWTSVALTAKSGSLSNSYEIEFPNGITWKPNEGAYPRLSKDSLMKAYEENRLWFGKEGKNIPRLKKYLSDVKQGMVCNSILYNINVGSTQYAKEQLKGILNANIFDTPKPTSLINVLLTLTTNKNSIILDSFSGSGTTAHAVLNLNKQDGGNRKFILVELEDYAETITAERVKRVIKGYGDTEGTGGSFDFYTVGESLFDEEQNLNENIPSEKIKEYIWFTETRSQYIYQKEDSPFLGVYNDTGYYFIYLKNELTTLDYDSLAKHVIQKSERYIIYADNCLLPEDFMRQHNIEFKKIPRNITRF